MATESETISLLRKFIGALSDGMGWILEVVDFGWCFSMIYIRSDNYFWNMMFLFLVGCVFLHDLYKID